LRHADAAVGAGEALGIQRLVSVDDRDQHQPAAKFHRQRHGLFQAVFNPRLHQQAIDHHFNGVILALVEREVVFQTDEFAIHTRTREAMLHQLLHLFFELAFTPANDGRHDHHAIIGRERHDALHDLFRRLPRDRLAAIGTMRNANRRIQQSQIIVNFGDCADG
jgi:hypothetical protein